MVDFLGADASFLRDDGDDEDDEDDEDLKTDPIYAMNMPVGRSLCLHIMKC